jgi:LacI family transcriptional regulator
VAGDIEAADLPGRVGRATMNDVASRARVSVKTVSRVVNGESGVLPTTSARVMAAISELGFRRNDSARQLRTGRTAGIGLVLEDVSDPFYSSLTRGVEEVAREHGCLLFTVSCDDDAEREQELALALCARRVDGLIIVPAATDHTYLTPELDAGMPVVFVDRPPVNLVVDVVLTDNEGGTHAGVLHLIANGHRRIGYLGDESGIFTAGERLRGYRRAMAESGLTIDDEWIVMGRPDTGTLRPILDSMLNRANPVTALFTGNSRLTVAALRELAGRAHRPALVGFDDFELADLVVPSISVVAQDPAGLGRVAAQLLFERLAGAAGAARRIMLPTTLIPRDSSQISSWGV